MATAAKSLFEPVDPILPLDYAACELGFSSRTLKRWHELGELEFIRLSPRGRIGIRRSELTRFINERCSAGQPANRSLAPRSRNLRGQFIEKAEKA